MLQAANPPQQQSPNLVASSFCPTVAEPFLAVLLSNRYSGTACGFCPACRAKPAASR
jgi:hypothetical protein